MASPLTLTLTDYIDPTRWRWVLSDPDGRFLQDHEVHLDPTTREYRGFLDLSQYLDFYAEAYTPAEQLATLGTWVGERLFGPVGEALRAHCAPPATAVQVSAPAAAQALFARPFELACFPDGQRYSDAGIRFVYQGDGAPPNRPKAATDPALRILAVFSLPVSANPLNLRRERYQLQRLVRSLQQTRGLAVELRILQYGATPERLAETLQEGEGWDLVHLSGHGGKGALLLEDAQGGTAEIGAEALGQLLRPSQARLKLLILDACHSGASHTAARRQLGLAQDPTRQEGAEGEALAPQRPTVLPSLAQQLAQQLDCAALAMRYPVGDGFATELMLALYDKLLAKRQPLPQALQLALADALKADDQLRPPLSPLTPILVGPRAADLRLDLPPKPLDDITLPSTGLGIGFPPEPERFVGRLQPMLRASQALAPGSARRGVLFHGMPGAGKSACALELAYRHEQGRFQGQVWYRAPEEEAGSDIAAELFNALFEIERQLNAPGLGLTTNLNDPQRFRTYTLPRLKALLEQHALLLVLDNLEGLLTAANRWRDPLWGELIATLLGHEGSSRVLLTARRLPQDLEAHVRLQIEPIHALSLAESVLLARELGNLKPLFDDPAGRALLQSTLRLAQGHPKLLELANGLAADRPALAARLEAAADQWADRADLLDTFLAPGDKGADHGAGETQQGEAAFLEALQGWTAGVQGGLPPTARLLFSFLCRLEPVDRSRGVVESNWKDLLNRLGDDHPAAPAALAEPELGLPAALTALAQAALIQVTEPKIEPSPEQRAALTQAIEEATGEVPEPAALEAMIAAHAAQATSYAIHPGVAESVRAQAEPTLLAAADRELGEYHVAVFEHGQKSELQGGGQTVVEAARRAAPYLMRQARWEEAGRLLEQMLLRDGTPATLAFALPLLRHIAEAEKGTARELMAAGVLARTLGKAGRSEEAEGLLRDLIARSAAAGEFRTASAAGGELLGLLRESGRLNEALSVAEEMAGYTRQAGLGPWSQLSDEARRLQVLNALGRCAEVLGAVERLRPQLEALSLEGEAKESANPWNVREVLLDTGHAAALYTDQWEDALTFNAQIVEWKEARGADPLELARTRFNDYAPLLRLQRDDQARALLQACRQVYETERAIPDLGRVYGALADLEDKTGNRAAAIRFQAIALGYGYQIGQPAECAIRHHNLAIYLEGEGADPATVLAHRLAAAALWIQTESGQLPTTVGSLANSELPPAPPPFAEVVAQVEAMDGVRFAALFARLPPTYPDGDAALAALWPLVAQERQRRTDLLAALPPDIRTAIDQEDDVALGAALERLPKDQAESIVQQLRDAGIIDVQSTANAETPADLLSSLPPEIRTAIERGDEAVFTAAFEKLAPEQLATLMELLRNAGIAPESGGPDMAQVLENFAPLLQAIAAAVSDPSQRPEIEALLPKLEKNGWQLTDPVHRLWSGERDPAALTADIDPNSAQLIHHLLTLLPTPPT